MEVHFRGANCILVTTKEARIVVDDNLADLGGKSVTKAGDIALFTMAHADPAQATKLTIDQPGEYEVSGVSIYGIAARGTMDEAKQKTATMYKIIFDDRRLLITGHIYPELSDEQLETIGMVDVMFVPVGGNGFTLDGIGALKLIKKIEPKLVIPVHYDSSGPNYSVPQQTLEQALQALTMEIKETRPTLKLKSHEFGDTTQLIVLEQA